MKKEIDKEKLYNFCVNELNNIYSKNCKNNQSKTETKIEENKKLTFNTMHIGTTIFLLNTSTPIPHIDIRTISSISLLADKSIIFEDNLLFEYRIYPEIINKNYHKISENCYIFLNTKELNEKYKEIGIQRIILLLDVMKIDIFKHELPSDH